MGESNALLAVGMSTESTDGEKYGSIEQIELITLFS